MCVTDVAFRVLCAQDGPDHATIARFRVQARDAFIALFSQILMVAAEAGLGRFGTVAIDGTKIAANASIDANRGKDWFDRRVTGMVAESEDTDQAEDMTARGAGDVGSDRVPAGLGDALDAPSGSGRPLRSCVPSCSAAPARMSNERLLQSHVAAGPATDSQWSDGSRTVRTDCPKHARTLPGKSRHTRTNSTGMRR
jgi:hypothetical protein